LLQSAIAILEHLVLPGDVPPNLTLLTHDPTLIILRDDTHYRALVDRIL
jgi:hypothetical protein